MTPRLINDGAKPIRLDPFQNIVNFSGSPEWLIIGHLAEWGFDPNGSATAYGFNTSKLPATIPLFTLNQAGGFSSYPPQIGGVVYSDIPTPSMGPLTTYTSPDTLAEHLVTLNPALADIFTRFAQSGYTVIKLNAIADAGQASLDFLVEVHTNGGGPLAHNATYDAPQTLPLAEFYATYPLMISGGFAGSGPYQMIGGLVGDDAVFSLPVVNGADADTYTFTGGYYNFLFQFATIAKVSKAVRPGDNSYGIGIYTSRSAASIASGFDFTVLTSPDPNSDFYSFWGGSYGDQFPGSITNDVMQGYSLNSAGTSAPLIPGSPLDPENYGLYGAGPAPPMSQVFSVSVDLTTFAVTVT